MNAVSVIALAAFLMSSANNPIRPDTVQQQMKPNIHLAAFLTECPNHSGSALRMPDDSKGKSKDE